MLLGSSIYPSLINVEGEQIQLGEFVRRAFSDSKLTVDEWNNLPEFERDMLIAEAIEIIRLEKKIKKKITIVYPKV